MDRRQKKTRAAVFQAFSTLLLRKRFEQITVREIIDQANIGRSTFYAHFETKNDLLKSMCTDIFHHVFTELLPQENCGEYAQGLQNLELKLGHILYHLREKKQPLKGILCSESGTLFLEYLKEYLNQLFSLYLSEFDPEIPRDYLLCQLSASFAETVKWWMLQDAGFEPEETAAFYMKFIGKSLPN